MNTAAAAAQANVTVATIRAWCRRGVVAAVKLAGRWIVEARSLAHRITLGKATMNPPLTLTAKVSTPGASIAVLGDADQLKAAYETGTPLTLDGKHAGEVVYLGHVRPAYDDGIGRERVGLDRTLGESPKFPGHTIAAYLVDVTRLDGAPRLAELHHKAQAAASTRAARISERVEREDDRLENLAEDGA
ncbi:hypothetical protein ABZ897_01010 [Nonomuraea sp. NPDC046802]|uniref:hypothetical protein n=1 Tax=Nonomuraea sp. NPDC046802 TaxID=3154919 RepID=UPI0033F861B4